MKPHDIQWEPERYELEAGPAYRFETDRREFLQLLGGGILLVLTLPHVAGSQQESGRRGGGRLPADLGAWLHIGEDGGVTVYTGKVEVGQNARTSLTQAVGDELGLPASSIRMVMGDTDLVPYDAGTFGSQSTPQMAPQLRRVAAAAREMLLDLAAENWKTDRAGLALANGKVSDGGGRSTDFGSLTKGQKLVKTIAANAAITPAARWKLAGTSVPKVNGRSLVTGQHRYSSDMKLPGMLRGKVLRAPAWGATLASIDTSAAAAMPGVTVVHDGAFVGVAAASEAAAERALAAIKAEWSTTPQPSDTELFDYLKKNQQQSRPSNAGGSIEEGLAAADHKLSQTYTVAYIAHTPLEPRAAVAQWTDGKLTVWTGTQRPFGVKGELVEAFGLPENRVRVLVPDTGSGYGGKHTGEAALEAARLAKAAGAPVKLVWTREEEFTWAYARPAGVIEIQSGVRKDGTLTAWEYHNYNSGTSGIRTLYDVANQKIEFHATKTPVRQGSYRGLAATANHFAREVHMDELARLAGLNPLEFRLKNLKDARFRAVLQAAADKFGWERGKTGGGRGYGIAGGFEKGGYIATCAEVIAAPGGKVQIVRLVSAFECGAIVNPDHLLHQVEGAVAQGIGGAMFEAIRFGEGKNLNPRFSSYRVPRFSDMPVIESVLLDRKDLPSAGAGETPIVGVAPAISNAICDATGIRLRSLPMVPKTLPAKG